MVLLSSRETAQPLKLVVRDGGFSERGTGLLLMSLKGATFLQAAHALMRLMLSAI